MKIITKIEDLETAYKEWYERLVEFMLSLIDLNSVSVILEAGCGSGGLTIPLATRVGEECKIIAYDLAEGPYEGCLETLRKTVIAKGFEGFIEIVKGDVKDMKAIADESVDLITSHDLFCDLDRNILELALKEFHRVLKRGGQMVHAELSPIGENIAQELLIKADLDYSLETMLPEGMFWFSPTVDDIAVLMHKVGFGKVSAHYFEINLKLGYNVAVDQLRKWRIDTRFVEEHEKNLQKYGIEFPLEHVVICQKL